MKSPFNSFMIGATIFLSAFLLFVIQPMISKYILPWYGGSPAVWTTCMLFFQTLLLLGYAYAHFLTEKFSFRTQVIIHVLLMVVAVIQLPPIPSEIWKLQAATAPVSSILLMLIATLGLPYVVLSATSPLLQRWYSILSPASSPYRLYALSNVGSLLALLSFPFIIEPALTRHVQVMGWAGGMILFILCCTTVGFILWRQNAQVSSEIKNVSGVLSTIPTLSRLLWVLFPAVSSLFLLATTNKLCQEITVIPLLWILPLALYLLSFIICFENPRWYVRRVFLALFALFFGGVVWALLHPDNIKLIWIIIMFPGLLFTVSMICHGEVARLKPSADKLTSYYLSISLGGAIGSMFVVLLAPVIFNDYSEYQIGIFLTIILLMVVYYSSKKSHLYRGKLRWVLIVNILFVIAGVVVFVMLRESEGRHVLAQKRNFYGMIKVEEFNMGGDRLMLRSLTNGHILHGTQFMDSAVRRLPTTYYSDESGLGKCIQYYPRTGSVRIGAIGLGVGTVAAWTVKGDYMRIYEINPNVKLFADEYFYYLKDAEGTIDYVPGDARLSLEREQPQNFDILILDAFNSDSPPVHLLTLEAFVLYLKHLKPNGVIAVHISSRYLDYYPLLKSLASRLQMDQKMLNETNPEKEINRLPSTWVLLSRNRQFLYRDEILSLSHNYIEEDTVRAWTDDYSSLFPILNW